jgi:uncharacterized protein (TIGR02996 family)
MTDGDALLRAVLAEPDDDTPRLIYADWLDEHDQHPRAAFIRDQIEAVRAEPYGPQARTAEARAADLLREHSADWLAGLPGNVLLRFERGFVGGVEGPPAEFARAAEALFAAAPVQTYRLSFDSYTADFLFMHEFFAIPQLRHLRRFECAPTLHLAAEDYELIDKCPHLAGLRDLSLRENPIHPPWLGELLEGDRLPELAGLDVADNPHLGPALAEALPRAKHRDIRRLDLSGGVFTAEQLWRILTSRCLRQAEELRLGDERTDGVGPLFALEIGWVISWDRLVLLDLAGQRLGNEAAAAIERTEEAAALRWLGLADNDLDSGAVEHLVAAKHLNLNHLDVRGNRLSAADLAALRTRFPLAVIVS